MCKCARLPLTFSGVLRMHKSILSTLLLVSSPVFAADPCYHNDTPECQVVMQERCRQASDMGLATARDLPATELRDIERKNELVEKLEALVARNRSNGVDECITWGEFNRIAVHQ